MDGDGLEGAGQEGLCIAARRWDPDRGVKFATYAYRWVQSRVLDDLHRGLIPTGKARYSADPEVRLRAARCAHVLRFSELPGGGGYDAPDRADAPREDHRRERLSEAIGRLPAPLAQVVELRSYGGLTLSRVGRELGFSKERARQLADKAHGLLRAMVAGGGA